MLVMYDSVTLDEIPADAQAVAGYTSGKWPTFNSIAARWPHAKHLSIAVSAEHDADCLDVENGDATPEQAPVWFHRQIKRGVQRPVLYASLSVLKDQLIPTMDAAGIHRGAYRVWSAHYTQAPHICGPSEGLSPPAEATQWTDHALGRNLDESLCSDGFLNVPVRYVNHQERNWIIEWDRLRGRWTLAAHMRRLFLRREMIERRKLIFRKASGEHDGWLRLDRIARWHALKERTG